jgi:hypothetical protein
LLRKYLDKYCISGWSDSQARSKLTIHDVDIHDDHTEKALRQSSLNEKTLLQYTVAVLSELCVRSGIEVDKGSTSRPLKKPYIKALLNSVRQHPSSLITNIDAQDSRTQRVTEMQDIQD